MNNVFREPLFQIGFIIKLFFIVLLIPKTQQEWFLPFILNWFDNPFSIPWDSFYVSNGNKLSFPYGPIMLAFHAPTTFIGWFIDLFLEGNYFAFLGFKLSLLIADFSILIVLLLIFEKEKKGVLLYYWLSPLVIFITYWHGQTDIIPIALFMFCLIKLREKKILTAGILLSFAVMAKHSILIALPFVIIYLIKQKIPKIIFIYFISIFIGAFLIIEFPFFFSDAFKIMVLGTKEIEKLYWLKIQMGEKNLIYITILIYLILLYFFSRIRKINFDLLFSALGVAFSIIIFMTPSSPGWYIWIIPILMLHQIRYGIRAVMLISSFTFIFIFFHLIYSSGSSIVILGNINFKINDFFSNQQQSIHYTLIISLGILIAIQILREGIRSNDYYQISHRPISLGIAGDSGAGKSFFSKSLAQLFGTNSTIEIFGDDYHNWDRSSPMWSKQTHLNPKSNQLFEMVRDVRKLLNGKAVYARSYNHKTGRFMPRKIRKSSDIIIVNGLHALYSKQLKEELDVSIFLEMDKNLQIYLKIKRDVEERGRDKENVKKIIEIREPDYKKFIQPQSKSANLVFNLLPVNPELSKNIQKEINLKLRVLIRNGIYYDELVRVLIGVCGLEVNLESIDENGQVVIDISGDVKKEDIKLATHLLLPQLDELIGYQTEFGDGITGIMQIITLMEIDEALKRRKLSNI